MRKGNAVQFPPGQLSLSGTDQRLLHDFRRGNKITGVRAGGSPFIQFTIFSGYSGRAALSTAVANVPHSNLFPQVHLKTCDLRIETSMKIILAPAALLLTGVAIFGAHGSAPAEKTFDAPHGLKVSVKMIGPYLEPADLQIMCLFKHKPSGDTYQGAAKDTDEHLHGLLSALRNRVEFVGELGETILFTPAMVPSRPSASW